MINAPNAIRNDESWYTDFARGSFQHILIQILTTVLLGPSLPNGYLLTTSLQKAVQSRRVRGGKLSFSLHARGDARLPKLF
jgi:hypothetical protein